MKDCRLPVWGIIAIYCCVAALAMSEGKLAYMLVFLSIYTVGIVTRQRLEISAAQERWLSIAAMIPLFLEQLFTQTHILHSLSHSLLFMVAIKLFKRKTRREVYILYFTGFAVMILAASSTRTLLIALPMSVYLISTALSIRQTVFGKSAMDLMKHPEVAAAVTASLLIAVLLSMCIPWLHQRVEFWFADYLGEQISIYSAFSGRSTFGDVGEMKINRKVVLRVFSQRPEKLIGKIFVRYTPEGWRSDASKARELLPDVRNQASNYSPHIERDDGSYFSLVPYQKFLDDSMEKMRVIMGTQTHRSLFTPYDAMGIQGYLESVFCDRHGAIYRQASFKGLEYLVYYIPGQLAGKLREAKMLAPGITVDPEEALVLPQNLRKLLIDLSEEFVGDAVSPLEQARRIKNSLETQYRYTRILLPVAQADPVWHFLFRSKAGNCEMFASAMALLLRARGLPSRYVTGFLMREKNFLGDYYVIRERDAHAWTEVYIAERGWVPMDATPAVMEEELGSPGITAFFTETIDLLRMKFQECGIKMKTLDVGEFITWLAIQAKHILLALKSGFMSTVPMLLSGLLLLLVFMRYRQVRKSQSTHRDGRDDVAPGLPYPLIKPGSPELEQLRGIFGEFENYLANKGSVRQPSQTLLEFLRNLENKGLTPPYLDYGKLLVDSYQQCRYGARPFSEKRIEALSRQWNSLNTRKDKPDRDIQENN